MLSTMHAEDYNLLLDPLVAERELERIGTLDKAIEGVANILIGRQVHDVIALRLVHRHHTLNPGEIMVEETGSLDDRPALVTKVKRADEYDISKLVPNVISTCDGKVRVAEYCESEILSDADRARSVLSNSSLIEDIANAIEAAGLKKVIGFGLRNKSFYHQGKKGETLLEVTDAQDHSNVVIWVKPPERGRKNITTLWGFRAGDVDAASMQNNAPTAAFETWNGVQCDLTSECKAILDPIGIIIGHREVTKHVDD